MQSESRPAGKCSRTNSHVKPQPAGKRPRLTPAPSPYALNLVRVQVGAGESAHEFIVPQTVLSASSEDFKTSLQKDKDGVTTILDLQRETPLIFAIFEEWLYGENAGSIILRPEYTGAIDCALCGQHQVEDFTERILVDLYVFANRCSVTAFKALVLQVVVEFYACSVGPPSFQAMKAVKIKARNKYDDLYLLMLAIWIHKANPVDGSDVSDIERQYACLPDPLKVDIHTWQDRLGGETFQNPALQAAAMKLDDLYCQVWQMASAQLDCEHERPQDATSRRCF